MERKQYGKGSVQHQRGLHTIGELFLSMPHNFRTEGLEVGIDAYVELIDPADERTSLGIHYGLQMKTVRNFKNDSDHAFDFQPHREDVKYWREGNIPTLLVVGRPDTGDFYMKFLEDYYDSRNDEKLVVKFNKKLDRIDRVSKARWAKELVKRARKATSEIAIPVAHAPEEAWTNLIVANLPSKIFRAPTNIGKRKAAVGILQENGKTHYEFIIAEKNLWSVHDLRTDSIWRAVCSPEATEEDDFQDFAFSDDASHRRWMVELLSHCLRVRLQREGFLYRFKENAFYFLPEEGAERTTKIEKHKSLLIEKAFSGGGKIFRHWGFLPDWRIVSNRYCLSITPTYLFTSDGRSKAKRHEEYLSGNRAMEKNLNFRSNIERFFHVLTTDDPLFPENNYPYLSFGDPITVRLPKSIIDHDWKDTHALRKIQDKDSQSSDLGPLFSK